MTVGTTTAPLPAPAAPGTAPAFRVAADGLNLRSAPRVAASTRLAVLHRGDVVRRIDGAADASWWRVATVVGSEEVRGYVARKHLVAEAEHVPEPAAAAIIAVHLAEGR